MAVWHRSMGWCPCYWSGPCLLGKLTIGRWHWPLVTKRCRADPPDTPIVFPNMLCPWISSAGFYMHSFWIAVLASLYRRVLNVCTYPFQTRKAVAAMVGKTKKMTPMAHQWHPSLPSSQANFHLLMVNMSVIMSTIIKKDRKNFVQLRHVLHLSMSIFDTSPQTDENAETCI